MIGIGVLFQYLILGTDWPENKNNGEIPGGLTELQFTSIFFLPSVLGLYGFWRIPAGYNFIKLTSNLPIEDKKATVKRAFDRMGKDAPEMTGDSMRVHYKGFLWSSFDVTILVELESFYINAQSRKDFDFNGGFIDLGSSYRLMKKIRRNIRACLVTTP